MNKDFHYGVIKIVARAAGFPEHEAEIIAYASQYTDDSTMHKPVEVENLPGPGELDRGLNEWIETVARSGGNFFDVDPTRSLVTKDGAFDPICTAHSNIEAKLRRYLKNFQVVKLIKQVRQLLGKETQRKVYIPFHFVPGKPRSEGESGDYDFFVERDGALANALLGAALEAYALSLDNADSGPGVDRELALVSVGIALHSLADTWSHEGFSGRWETQENDIENLYISTDGYEEDHEQGYLPDLGHIEAKGYPDKANIGILFEFDKKIQGRSSEVNRENPVHFLDAGKAIYDKLLRANVPGHPVPWHQIRKPMLQRLSADLGVDARIAALQADLRPVFNGDLVLEYKPEHWEDAVKDPDTGKYRYDAEALWFKFHIAAAAQRSIVVKNIGPF